MAATPPGSGSPSASPPSGDPPGAGAPLEEDGERPRRQRLGAYGIVGDAEGRLLLVRASRYLTVAGRWFLPGGGVDHGETPTDALRREVGEETGLLAGSVTLLGVLSDTWPLPDGTDLHTVRLLYRVEDWSGALRHELDGSSDLAAWFDAEEVATLPLARYARAALERYAGIAERGDIPADQPAPRP